MWNFVFAYFSGTQCNSLVPFMFVLIYNMIKLIWIDLLGASVRALESIVCWRLKNSDLSWVISFFCTIWFIELLIKITCFYLEFHKIDKEKRNWAYSDLYLNYEFIKGGVQHFKLATLKYEQLPIWYSCNKLKIIFSFS